MVTPLCWKIERPCSTKIPLYLFLNVVTPQSASPWILQKQDTQNPDFPHHIQWSHFKMLCKHPLASYSCQTSSHAFIQFGEHTGYIYRSILHSAINWGFSCPSPHPNRVPCFAKCDPPNTAPHILLTSDGWMKKESPRWNRNVYKMGHWIIHKNIFLVDAITSWTCYSTDA